MHIACLDDMNWSFYAGDSKMNLVELFPELRRTWLWASATLVCFVLPLGS